MFFRVQQYGGSLRRNYIHRDNGADFPDSASVFVFNVGSRFDIIRLDSIPVIFTHVDPDYEFYRPTGFMVWEGNPYEVRAGSAYAFSGAGKDDQHKMKKVLIRDEDWKSSVLKEPTAGRLRILILQNRMK